MRILKYTTKTEVGEPIYVELPKEAEIIDVAFQFEKLCVWAVVYGYVDKHDTYSKGYYVWSTGKEIDMPGDWKYLKTIHISAYNMNTVWHIFEEIADAEEA